MRSRWLAVATTLALLIGLAPSLATVCVGWESSAKARMACCAKSHGDVSAGKADDCCKAGEQRANGRVDGGIMSVVLPDVRLIAACPAPAILRAAPGYAQSERHRAPQVPTHLLLAVFLL